MGSGRTGTGAARYRRSRASVLADSDLCGLCGHGGARTTDHLIPPDRWPTDAYGRKLPGFDEPGNLQPAHGTMGNKPPHNPCPICGRLCNQSRGNTPLPAATRRPW